MIHAREDYQHIQDDTGRIGENEPVFLLRAQDVTAPSAVEFWAIQQMRSGNGDKALIDLAFKQVDAMRDWQRHNKTKVADL